MRRSRWLLAGVVLGIIGYRRADRAARSVVGALEGQPLVAGQPTGAAMAVREVAASGQQSLLTRREALTGHWSTAGLAMKLAGWLVRQLRGQLRVQLAAGRATRAGGLPRRAGALPRAGIRPFFAEVRAGMAEYTDAYQANMNRQQARSGNTLRDQRAQVRTAHGRTAMPGAIPGRALGPGPSRLRAESDKTKDGC